MSDLSRALAERDPSVAAVLAEVYGRRGHTPLARLAASAVATATAPRGAHVAPAASGALKWWIALTPAQRRVAALLGGVPNGKAPQ